MKTKQAHIEKIRQKFAYNQQCILVGTGLSAESYTDLWLDMGTAYLNARYPIHDAKYACYHRIIMNDPDFWRWWISEWKLQENRYVGMFPDSDDMEAQGYRRVMYCLLDSHEVDQSFAQNYLSLIGTAHRQQLNADLIK